MEWLEDLITEAMLDNSEEQNRYHNWDLEVEDPMED